MTDEPRRLDFSPAIGQLGQSGQPAGEVVPFRYARPTPPPALDGPGYLVVYRGELAPGSPVAIGTMPAGLAGGVDEWRPGRIAEADGMPAPAEGEPGWYVPEGAIACPRCGDQNWTAARLCITCTDGDDAYADGAFAAGWSPAALERARAHRTG